MGYLKDLKVKKVSLVSSGANRKQFFLAKSADFVEKTSSSTNNNNNDTSGGAQLMRPEIKAKVAAILKEERNFDKVCAILKEDAVLKVTDAEASEIRDFLSLIPVPDASALEKAQADARKAEEEKQKLEARLNKIEEDRHRDEIRKWVDSECGHLNMNAEDATSQILKAEKLDKETAEALKKSFKATSEALKSSVVLREIGRDGESYDPLCGNLVAEVTKKAEELSKSSSEKQSEVIVNAIKSVGGRRYEQYRREFNQRAKTA